MMQIQTIKPLPFDGAMQLYFLIKDFIPTDFDANYDFLTFVGKVVNDMSVKEYVDTVSLMTGIPTSQFRDEDAEDIFKIFGAGIAINNTYELIEFCKKMSF